MPRHRISWDLSSLFLLLAVAVAAVVLPTWMMFAASTAMAQGIAAIGICALMRSGNISFGQSLPLCVGAYTAALLPRLVGVNDFFLNCAFGGLMGALACALLGLFMKRFTGIFFAMLSLAFSMVLFGTLSNIPALGGTDGFSAAAPSFLGQVIGQELRPTATFVATGLVSALALFLTGRLYRSRLGWAARAVGENDVRVTYLGGNSQTVVWAIYTFSGFLAGIGGALIAAISGHVAPEMAYWTHSGELVLIAILGNSAHTILVFAASFLIEAMRVVSMTAFPYTWQAGLGTMLLVIVLVFPNGLDSLVKRFLPGSASKRGGVT